VKSIIDLFTFIIVLVVSWWFLAKFLSAHPGVAGIIGF